MLRTKIILNVIGEFKIATKNIHNDSTSIKFFGSYSDQKKNAIQLKRGHSKDHRPDLKQAIYNLCVSDDGTIPLYFKVYNGNQTDDRTHWETWKSLQGLLGKSDFCYIADSKLCTSENMNNIDKEGGIFITVVPEKRNECKKFCDDLYDSTVRWEEILRKQTGETKGKKFEIFHCAQGLYQLSEGYRVYWYRSNYKEKRDESTREEKIDSALDQLNQLRDRKSRGPQTERRMLAGVEKILRKYGVSQWIHYEIKMDEVEEFKKLSRGRASKDSPYRRVIKKIPRLVFRRDVEGIARSKSRDGVFPLVTNSKLSAREVLQQYKYQPRLEKRFNLLKTGLGVAPVFLKNNERIEALMFIYFLAQLLCSLIERTMRTEMTKQKRESLKSLPEGRETKTPTWDQIRRLFDHCGYHELFQGEKQIKTFSEGLSPIQEEILGLLKIPKKTYT